MKKLIITISIINIICALLIGVCACLCLADEVEDWQITAYCSCAKCCGKWADGYMASGVKCKVGYCSCNIVPFGTEVEIEGMGTYIVKDTGASKYFDDKKHIDIYFDNHEDAKNFGVKYRQVVVR